MSATVQTIRELQQICSKALPNDPCTGAHLMEAAALVDRRREVWEYVKNDAFMDAAIALLPDGAVWRKYTDRCFTVYGASPFNAAMQERFDGYSENGPLALASAVLSMHFARLLKTTSEAA